MWHGFKKYFLSIFFLGVSIVGIAQKTEGLIHNLRQNWVQYNQDAESFLPAISQASGNAISFNVDGTQYKSYLLYIKNSKKAYLFHNKTLLIELNKGEHILEIDSLLEKLNSNNPVLSIYGEKIKNGLHTYIISQSYAPMVETNSKDHIRQKSYTSFFILVSILLLVGLIIIKVNSKELYSQYTSILRVFNLSTIDELIYKGRFFVNPGIQIIVWLSFSAAFSAYFLILKFNFYTFDFSWLNPNTIASHSLHLISIGLVFVLYFLLKYILVSSMALIFDITSIKNVHFATHLRLLFFILIVLQLAITLDYFSIIYINTFLFLLFIFGTLLSTIILIGIRLSFIVKHSFIQLFLYLCGTEIFIFVFVYKLVVG